MGSARSRMASRCGHRKFNCLRTLVTQRFRPRKRSCNAVILAGRRLRWDRGLKTRADSTPALQTGQALCSGQRHNTGAISDLSASRSDLDVDRQVQLDETRLQQRHGQVIVQFNPGVGVAWRPPELLEDDLAGLPKR